MNIKLLRRIKNMILKRPRQFVMNDVLGDKTEFGAKPSHCGTAACIAGWAVTLGDGYRNPKEAGKKHNGSFLDRAQELLEITCDGREHLFHEDSWPEEFQLKNAKTHPQFARLAAARIEHFIKTDGTDKGTDEI